MLKLSSPGIEYRPLFWKTSVLPYTELSVSVTVRHPLIFSSHLLLINTRGFCRLLHHRHSTRGYPRYVSLSILYLFIIIFNGVWTMHNFYYDSMYQPIFILDMFISFPGESVLITWIGLFFTLWGHHSVRTGGFSHILASQNEMNRALGHLCAHIG